MEKKKELEKCLEDFLTKLGLDLNDPNLKETPERMTRMYMEEFFKNVESEPYDLIKSFPNEKKYDEIIMMDNIPFVSMCSHHFLPFPGLAWILYIPDTLLAGASKPSRVLSFFEKKPQLQENLAMEVADFFEDDVKPKGMMLVMRAIHGCMSYRGAKTGGCAGLTTSITRGCFRDSAETRNEAFSLIHLSIALKGVM